MDAPPREPSRPRIPTPEENAEARRNLETLIGEATTCARSDHASLAIVFGNGLSQLDLEYFKKALSATNRELHTGRLSQEEAERRTSVIYTRAWELFERWRLGTWSCLPAEPAGFALLLQWILAGFTRLVFTTNYDLFLESLLLRWPGRPPAPRLLLNPLTAGGHVNPRAPAGLRSPCHGDELRPTGPVLFFKCNGTTAFMAFKADDWTVWARPGPDREASPSVQREQLITVDELQAAVVTTGSWGRPDPFDLRRSRFQRACHHVDALGSSDLFELERNGARSAFEQHREKLKGVIILGHWGQRGEALNSAILDFAGRKPVVQILWYPPREDDYRNRPGLWNDLPEGSRHLLLRDDYENNIEVYPDAPAAVDPEEEGPAKRTRVRRQKEIRRFGHLAGGNQLSVAAIEAQIKTAGVWLRTPAHQYDGAAAVKYDRLLQYFDGELT